MDVRIEVVPKRRRTPPLAPPPSLLQRAVSEDALDLLDRLMTAERQEDESKRRFDAAARAVVPAPDPLTGADGASRLSTRLLQDMKAQRAAKLMSAAGGAAASDKDEKLANPTVAVTREQLYDLIRTIQSEQHALREAQTGAVRAHAAAALNEALLDAELQRDAELRRLRAERNAQDERFTELRLRLESKSYESVAAIVRAGRERLSEVRVAEMTRREAEVAAAQQLARKQADEFSVLRLQLEQQNESKLQELRGKQELMRQQIQGRYMPGEEDVIASARESRVYCITPRSIKQQFGQTGEYHFRYAESQFLRLTQGQNYTVLRVDYIVNAPLVVAFQDKAAELKRRNRVESMTILGFHGTSAASIDGIIRTNFSLAKLASGTGDNGWYGAGVYFSEFTSVSLGYNKTQSTMLLSRVLTGKIWKCPGRMDGAPLKSGFDSHLSPDGFEVVIFDADQILPCYLVHYTLANNASGQSAYHDQCEAVVDLRDYHLSQHDGAAAGLQKHTPYHAAAVANASVAKAAYADDLAAKKKAKAKSKPWSQIGKPKRGGKRKH